MLPVINSILMVFPTEYTGAGISSPHNSKGMLSSFEATFVSLTNGATAALEHSVITLGSGSKVKFKKDNLIRPLGTVIVQIHCCIARKLPGKLGLETNPLDAPLIFCPGPEHATGNINKNTVSLSQTVIIQQFL